MYYSTRIVRYAICALCSLHSENLTIILPKEKRREISLMRGKSKCISNSFYLSRFPSQVFFNQIFGRVIKRVVYFDKRIGATALCQQVVLESELDAAQPHIIKRPLPQPTQKKMQWLLICAFN